MNICHCYQRNINDLVICKYFVSFVCKLITIIDEFPIYTQQNIKVYGTPSNIYKDERISKYNNNYGFKKLRIYNICPKNAL